MTEGYFIFICHDILKCNFRSKWRFRVEILQVHKRRCNRLISQLLHISIRVLARIASHLYNFSITFSKYVSHRHIAIIKSNINQSNRFTSSLSLRYRNNSVDEIFRVDNTSNYEGKTGEKISINTKELEVVGIAGVSQKDYIDEKGVFAAVSPADAPAVLTWNNVSVSTKPPHGKQSKTIINNINGCISGGLWGIMGASGNAWGNIQLADMMCFCAILRTYFWLSKKQAAGRQPSFQFFPFA